MVAAAAATHDTWSADWYGTMEACAPWLFDTAGNPIEVPAEAIGFRVRCLPPGSRGIGELVHDELTGLPLLVARGAGPDDFCAAVRFRAGRYRLAPIDERYQYLRAPVATFLITSAMAAAHEGATNVSSSPPSHGSPTTARDELVFELVAALRAVVADSMQVIKGRESDGARNVSELVRATATVVTAADGAGISRRDPLPLPAPVVAPPPPPPAAVANDEEPQAISDILSTTVSSLAPALQHFANTKLFGMSDEMSVAMLRAMSGGAAPASTSETPAPAPPPTAPASSPPPPPPSPSPAPAPAPVATPSAATVAPINPAALWPHVGAIERLLRPDEAAVVRRYLEGAEPDQVGALAREVMARTPAEAAAWIRALLVEVHTSAATTAATAAPAGR